MYELYAKKIRIFKELNSVELKTIQKILHAISFLYYSNFLMSINRNLALCHGAVQFSYLLFVRNEAENDGSKKFILFRILHAIC